jgi:hypothetical protein
VLKDHLKGHHCVVGNSPTLADFAIGPWLNFAERAGYPIAPYGEIKRWHATFILLPARRRWPRFLGDRGISRQAAKRSLRVRQSFRRRGFLGGAAPSSGSRVHSAARILKQSALDV